MKGYSFRNVINGAAVTLRRFPHALFCAIAVTICLWYLIDHQGDPNIVICLKLLMTFSIGVIGFTALAVFDERYTMRRHTVHLMHGLFAGFLALYYFWLPAELTDQTIYRYALLMIAAHLAVSFSPYVVDRNINGFWQYNKALFLRILTAFLYTTVLFLGLMLAILAVQTLFEVDVKDKVYMRLWFFLAGIFNTWFFLAGVPESVNDLETNQSYPKGLRIFTQYVLLPLVTIYLLILYAYSLKILITMIWPRGWVSYLVIGFSTTGILALLLVWPLREEEQYRWIRAYTRGFFIALFPLILLLAFAIGRRISEYGITENRYLIIALAFWLFVNALYFLFSHIKNIKVIPMSLFVLAILSGYGPFSAFEVSRLSQTKRFREMLKEQNLLEAGFVKSKHHKVSDKVGTGISQSLYYIIQNHGAENVQQFFKVNLDSLAKADSLSDYELSRRAAEMMDIEFNLYADYLPLDEPPFNYSANRSQYHDISGFDVLFPVNYYNSSQADREAVSFKDHLINWRFDAGTDSGSIVFIVDSLTYTIPVNPTLRALNNKYSHESYKADLNMMQIDRSYPKTDIRILFNSFNGNMKDSAMKLESFDADVLLKFH